MILGRDTLKALVLNIKLSYHVIKGDDGPFKSYTEPMVDLVTYEFKYLNKRKIIPEKLFMNNNTEDVH